MKTVFSFLILFFYGQLVFCQKQADKSGTITIKKKIEEDSLLKNKANQMDGMIICSFPFSAKKQYNCDDTSFSSSRIQTILAKDSLQVISFKITFSIKIKDFISSTSKTYPTSTNCNIIDFDGQQKGTFITYDNIVVKDRNNKTFDYSYYENIVYKDKTHHRIKKTSIDVYLE